MLNIFSWNVHRPQGAYQLYRGGGGGGDFLSIKSVIKN